MADSWQSEERYWKRVQAGKVRKEIFFTDAEYAGFTLEQTEFLWEIFNR